MLLHRSIEPDWTRRIPARALCSVIAGALLGIAEVACAQKTSVSGVPARDLVVTINSRVLGEKRFVHVHLPANYELARQRYPTVYLLDGQVKAFWDVTVATVGYDLTGSVREFAMPPQIVVGIEQGDRRKDLAVNDSLFLRFLVEEVVPWVERTYRASGYRTIIGHSLAGRFVLQSLCRAPGSFHSVLALSAGVSDSTAASSTRDCVRSALRRAPTAPQQLLLSAGSLEPRNADATRSLHAFLRDSAPPSWRTGTVNGDGLGHTGVPARAIAEGLRWVFDAAMWELPPESADSIANGLGDGERVLALGLEGVSRRVGMSVAPSLKWRRTLAARQLTRGTPGAAVAAARALVEAYPEELQGYANLADALMRQNDAAGARRAVSDGLAMLEKLDWHDRTQYEAQRAWWRSALAAIPR